MQCISVNEIGKWILVTIFDNFCEKTELRDEWNYKAGALTTYVNDSLNCENSNKINYS